MKKLVLIGLAVFVAGLNVAARQNIRDEFVDIGGYRLHFVVAGEANPDGKVPPIILESGASGNGLKSSADFQQRLAAELHTPVVAYDRVGAGESDLPDVYYDIEREVSDLRTALAILGFRRQLILVGSSYGGQPACRGDARVARDGISLAAARSNADRRGNSRARTLSRSPSERGVEA